MKIKMLSTQLGSLDGIKVISFEKGKVLDVPDNISLHLANIFIEENYAKEIHLEPKQVKENITIPNEPNISKSKEEEPFSCKMEEEPFNKSKKKKKK
jgi:hypothetical protein